ncbi:TIGR02757 family protein [uncultured Phocaeicola sp.]|uniref:TIGR02757 family protein n=1 Tax=uncultured Phocaeicola sp. TaxID=990718 RepID=UPI0030C7225F
MLIKNELDTCLCKWAEEYHCSDFIAADPVQFPHRYTVKEDIEISGLLTAVLSFGNRIQILKKADELDRIMGHVPLTYVLSGKWRDDFPESDGRSFYRMLSYADVRGYFEKLYRVYAAGKTLEDALKEYKGIPMQQLCSFLGVSDRSPQKKLNMFLRWMIRTGSPVDFGIWSTMSASQLVIPLDTHVCRVAYQLGLTESASFSLNNAKKITAALEKVFPGDPCLGDFALFGYGVNHKE